MKNAKARDITPAKIIKSTVSVDTNIEKLKVFLKFEACIW